MGYRLSRIYTRTGDQGNTDLGNGTRVAKDHPRIHAYGEIDELNSQIGLVGAEALPEEIQQLLKTIQHDLFALGAELIMPGHQALDEDRISRLEERIEGYNEELGPLTEFILPGGCRAAAQAHVARTICRRAERALHALSRKEAIAPVSATYLNRLSDLLFVVARLLNHRSGRNETLWQRADGKSENLP